MSGENLLLVGKLCPVIGDIEPQWGYSHLADTHLVEAAERVGNVIADAMGQSKQLPNSGGKCWPVPIRKSLSCNRVLTSCS